MKAITRRVRNLEVQRGMGAETEHAQRLRHRLAEAMLRCGLPEPSPERIERLRRMSIHEIMAEVRNSRDTFHPVHERMRNLLPAEIIGI